MEWLKFTIYTHTSGIEALCSHLYDVGYKSVEIEDFDEFNNFLENNSKYWDYVDDELVNQKKGDTKIIFYIENNSSANDELAKINSLISELKRNDTDKIFGSLETEITGLNEEDWANNWKKYFKPIEVGEKILIQPEWCPYDKSTDRVVFTVNPGMTFGTGTHASTKMCIRELEKVVTDETVLLDAGCGSGILSVISLMLGAKKAVAVDIDDNCIHTAYENAERNKTDKNKYFVYSGDIINDKELFKKISDEKYDVIVANIVADVIISILPLIKKLINKGGTFICSGIIKERLEDVKSAMAKENITPYEVCEEDDWNAITCKF